MKRAVGDPHALSPAERLKAKVGAHNASALVRLATVWVEQGCLPSPRSHGAV